MPTSKTTPLLLLAAALAWWLGLQPLQAQVFYSLGARGGMGLCGLDREYESNGVRSSPIITTDSKRRVPNLGLWVEFDIDDFPASIIFATSYRNRGFRALPSTSGLPGYGRYQVYNRVDYVGFDFLSRFYFTDTKVKPYIAAGLRFDTRVGGNSRLEKTFENVQDAQAQRQYWEEDLEEWNSALLGGVLHAGLRYDRYGFEFEWNPDLSRAGKYPNTSGGSTVINRFNTWGFNFLYTFATF